MQKGGLFNGQNLICIDSKYKMIKKNHNKIVYSKHIGGLPALQYLAFITSQRHSMTKCSVPKGVVVLNCTYKGFQAIFFNEIFNTYSEYIKYCVKYIMWFTLIICGNKLTLSTNFRNSPRIYIY